MMSRYDLVSPFEGSIREILTDFNDANSVDEVPVWVSQDPITVGGLASCHTPLGCVILGVS